MMEYDSDGTFRGALGVLASVHPLKLSMDIRSHLPMKSTTLPTCTRGDEKVLQHCT